MMMNAIDWWIIIFVTGFWFSFLSINHWWSKYNMLAKAVYFADKQLKIFKNYNGHGWFGESYEHAIRDAIIYGEKKCNKKDEKGASEENI